ncbi:hypothetical protein [Streptomyces rishiriensis]|uniref:hypothetical protein n=1 Tax=Streptomyces rishiriensis TaxID=68264 RepID=UPI0027D92F24|nr:hypothetical protein [Streptomyces rishiriensis]
MPDPALPELCGDGPAESRDADLDQEITRLARTVDAAAAGEPWDGDAQGALPSSLRRRLRHAPSGTAAADDRTPPARGPVAAQQEQPVRAVPTVTAVTPPARPSSTAERGHAHPDVPVRALFEPAENVNGCTSRGRWDVGCGSNCPRLG